MPVYPIFISGGNSGSSSSGDGHIHPNLNSLNRLNVEAPGKLLVDGVRAMDEALEKLFTRTLTASDISNQYVSLPEEVSAGRATTVSIESVSMVDLRDWEIDSAQGRIRWNIAGSKILEKAKAGDVLSITY